MFDKFVDFRWKTNSFIDIWTFVHLSWGVILGILLVYYAKLTFWQSFLVAIFLMISWEAFEVLTGVGEKWTNVLSDVLIGIVGFVIAYVVITYFPLLINKVLVITIVVMLIMEYIGWMVFLKS